jgi:hypothetical protein
VLAKSPLALFVHLEFNSYRSSGECWVFGQPMLSLFWTSDNVDLIDSWLTQESTWSHILQLSTFGFSVCFRELLICVVINYSVLHKGEKESLGGRETSHRQWQHNTIPIFSTWNGQGTSCLMLLLELREMELGLVTNFFKSWCDQTYILQCICMLE